MISRQILLFTVIVGLVTLAAPALAESKKCPQAVDDFVSAKAKDLDCEENQSFFVGTAFDCDKAKAEELAHERAHDSAGNICRKFKCDPKKGNHCVQNPNSGFCTLPETTEIKTKQCPRGVGFVSTVTCVVDCFCVI